MSFSIREEEIFGTGFVQLLIRKLTNRERKQIIRGYEGPLTQRGGKRNYGFLGVRKVKTFLLHVEENRASQKSLRGGSDKEK